VTEPDRDDRYARQILRLMAGLTRRGITVTVPGGAAIEVAAVDTALAVIDQLTHQEGPST